MSSMETINDEIEPNREIPADSATKQAKRVFIGLAATITIGLVIAGWYVGGRIFAVDKVHAAAAIAKPISSTVEATPVAEPVTIPHETPKTSDAATAAWNTVDPQPGELYLQLATMGPNSTNEYLKALDSQGIHPRIAPGPSDNLHRIVLGPYPDKAALEKQQQELEASGIQFMARRY
jgi:cell division septation protein DedD